MKTRSYDTLLWLVLGAVAILAFNQASDWAQLAQWREDQAMDIWLGLNFSPSQIPIAHRSSVGLPMPNGYPLIAILLARLPSLLAVSTFWGCLQSLALAISFRLGLGEWRKAVLLWLPIATLPLLGGMGAEFAGPYFFVTINAIFLSALIRYIDRPSTWFHPLFVFLLLLPPSIYLSGVAYSIAYVILLAGCQLKYRPKLGPFRNWIAPGAIAFAILGLSARYTWIPFLKITLNEGGIHGWASRSVSQKVVDSLTSAGTFPVWLIRQWSRYTVFFDWHLDGDILRESAESIKEGLIRCFQILSGAFLFALFIHFGEWIEKRWKRTNAPIQFKTLDKPGSTYFWLSLALALTVYLIYPLIGGPRLYTEERWDQRMPLIPLFLTALFLAPWVLNLPRIARQTHFALVGIIAFGVCYLNIAARPVILNAHQNYRGSSLPECDVPLTQKSTVLSKIAADWKIHGDHPSIAVDYALDGRWGWLKSVGSSLSRWYPAPFTLGRSFDYELKRIYGLTNSQEGIQDRKVGQGRYIISYAWQPPPPISQPLHYIENQVIGRLRLSIVRDQSELLIAKTSERQ